MERLKRILFGKSLDPLSKSSHKSLVLTALLAWVGLGADGLSSSCYGPQEAFLALQGHTELALFLALAIGITVFLIALSYNQVIELFPMGGGGYKVASTLLGETSGLITGSALIMDYTLTIVISVTTGIDALFSLLPSGWEQHKIMVDAFAIILLIILNLRGMKESIKVLLPIFIAFVIVHILLIGYGVFAHADQFGSIMTQTVHNTHALAASSGLFFVVALFMHAYAMGGGTYTGLEAVSNNVNTLAQPRVRTGKLTMFYMAISLSVMAAGIMLIYMLWHVTSDGNKTLNAIVFAKILGEMPMAHGILILTLCLEAGLLFMSANTGFLGGPAVLANMAVDEWLPHRFRFLSNRLVKQNGILLYGIASLIILFVSDGNVTYLVVLYSLNVFLAFTISLFGLVKHWWQELKEGEKVWQKFFLAAFAAIVCFTVLMLIFINRFFSGGWFALFCLVFVTVICALIRKHYKRVNAMLNSVDELLIKPISVENTPLVEFDGNKPTAVIMIGKHSGVAMHTLIWSLTTFADYFKNVVFMSIGEIDVERFGVALKLNELKQSIENNITYFTEFAQQQGLAVRSYVDYSTNPVDKMDEIANTHLQDIHNPIFFAGSLVWGKDTWYAQYLHNETAFAMQKRLHNSNRQMIIVPMKVDIETQKRIVVS
jgi:amino acid transporter